MAHRPNANSSDVARAAGVSRATVSYVLNDRADQSIPEETRRRILQAAAALRYRPNRIARSLISGKSQLIGVTVSQLHLPEYGRMTQGVQEICRDKGYQILITNPHYYLEQVESAETAPLLEREQVDFLLEHRVAGIISILNPRPVAAAIHWLTEIQEEGVYGVMMDNEPIGAKLNCVVTADIEGARSAVQHLLDQGHRRIGHLFGGEMISTGRERRSGYSQAMTEAEIAIDPDLISGDSYAADRATVAMECLLALPSPPTAVFAANDNMAEAAMRVVRESGRRIPDDIAFVGYGDLPQAPYLDLTSVRQDFVEMGREAARLLFATLADPTRPPHTVRVPTQLVRRGSS